MCGLQVVRVLPELRPTMQFLWDNRRAWNERYLVELANDRAKAPADKDAERARAPLCSWKGALGPGAALLLLLQRCTDRHLRRLLLLLL